MQKIVCDNGSDQIVITYADPLWLIDADGLTSADFDVYTSKFGTQDGEYYNGSTAKKRPIVITASIFGDYKSQRTRLYTFFPRGSQGTLYYYEDNDAGKKIEYYVEKIQFSFNEVVRTVTISLICPDPLFSDLQATQVPMSYWKKLLRFPFTFQPPLRVAERIAEKIVTVYNNTNVAAGLLIYFTARGSVANPGMTEVRTQKRFQLNTQMMNGDTILVNTNQNEKGASFQEDPEYVDMWHFGDTWLQLQPGENVFQYFADSGADYLDVKIIYMPRYWGA